MLTSKVLKLAVTEGGGGSSEWKVHPVDEKSFIMLIQVVNEMSVLITGPFNIRLAHTDKYPLKAYIRKNDLAIKFWSLNCWRKIQVTLSDRIQLMKWAQKFHEFGVIVVNKDEYISSGWVQGSQMMESQMMESQRVAQEMESQRVSQRVESQAHPSLWMAPPMTMPIPIQPLQPLPLPSKVYPTQETSTIKDLSDTELKMFIMSCLDRKDFVELVSNYFLTI